MSDEMLEFDWITIVHPGGLHPLNSSLVGTADLTKACFVVEGNKRGG